MEYISVRNLEKFHPGYKDRSLIWAKIHVNLVQGDPEFELIENEIDKWRFVAIVLLQLDAKKPLPNLDRYWKSKGFDLKKRSMSLTIKMLHNFLDSGTEDTDLPCRRVEESRVEENSGYVTEKNILEHFNKRVKKNLLLTDQRKNIISTLLRRGVAVADIHRAIDNFAKDDWADRHKYCDIIYCLGVRNKVDNYEKWLNYNGKSRKGQGDREL